MADLRQEFDATWELLLAELDRDVQRPDYKPAQIDEGDKCTICLRAYNDAEEDPSRPACEPVGLSCGHIVGLDCLREHWNRTKDTLCPFCRQRISTVGIPHTTARRVRYLYSNPWFKCNLRFISTAENRGVVDLAWDPARLAIFTLLVVGEQGNILLDLFCMFWDSILIMGTLPPVDDTWASNFSRRTSIGYLIAILGMAASMEELCRRFYDGLSLRPVGGSWWGFSWIIGRLWYLFVYETVTADTKKLDDILSAVRKMLSLNHYAMVLVVGLIWWTMRMRRKVEWIP